MLIVIFHIFCVYLGFRAEMCTKSDPESTRCVPCEENEYLEQETCSAHMYRCALQPVCRFPGDRLWIFCR